MKRIVSALLSAAFLLVLLPACQGSAAESDPPEPLSEGPAALEAVNMVFSSCGFDGTADVEYLTMEVDAEFLAAYLENAYGLSAGTWEDAAVIRAAGASAFELAVLRLEDGEAAARAAAELMSYIFNRQGDFAGYAPAEADMVAAGGIAQDGPYAALFICPDTDMARAAFEAALSGDPLPTQRAALPEPETYEGAFYTFTLPEYDSNYPDRIKFVRPNKDDMSLYDTSAILAAWEKGNPAELSDYDRKIYDAAKDVLDKVLKNGMSDYEKELAVYDWVVQNVNYDWTHQDRMKTTPRESFTPYGGLVNHKAVCLGYAATFQLLMNLAGVECITVPGAAFSSMDDHGWNMVRLNGEWYCVDVTWDANMREQVGRGRQEDWSYFNVTSDYMANTDHQWDYANTPEATSENKGGI